MPCDGRGYALIIPNCPGGARMSSFWQDVRYSLRMIAKAPGYAAIAVLTLALGIGANTTIFSWINSTLLNPIPGLASPNEVVALTLGRGDAAPFPFTYPDFESMRDGQQSFVGLTASNIAPMSLTGKGKPERVWGMVTSANYFDLLGVRPILGRGFLPEEDTKPGGAPVAVISYRLWQTHFGANPDVIGQTLEINQHPYTIVGVTPAVFQGSQTGLRSEIWIPIMMEEQLLPQGDLIHDHHYFWLGVLGRLKPGVRPEQAQEEMTLRLKREAKNYPEEHKGHDSVSVYPLWRNPFGANQFLSTLLPMLMTIAGLVLLLACANVANLMLVRSVARREPLAAGAATTGGEFNPGTCGRVGCVCAHVLDCRNIHEIRSEDGFPDLARNASGPHRAVGDDRDLGAYRGDLRHSSCAAGLGRSADRGAEGRYGERVGRNAQGAPRKRAGCGADFAVVAALDLRGAIHSQFHERAAD